MPNPFLRLFALSLVVLLVPATRGDVVVLKGGEKLEGKILEETPTEVRMNVQISASIVDERSIPRAEVDKIEKTPGDENAWAVLKTFQPGANSLPAAQYDRFIAPLTAFTKQYPQSAHFADAQKALTAFEEEKKRVDGGDLKLDGNWLSKAEAQAERYQINGLLTLNYMRSEQARGDLVGALNAFDIIEKQFPNSRSYPDAVELAIKMMNTLKAQAVARQAAISADKVAQDKAIAAAVEPARTQMRATAEQARTAAEATLAAASKQGLKWPPFLASSSAAMSQIADKAGSESGRLASIDLNKMRQSLELADKAKKQLADQDLAGAEASLTQARSLWEPNELVTRLAAELATAQAAAKAAAAKPKATPVPATPEPVVAAPVAAAPDEAPPDNPWFKIVLGSIVAIIGIVGLIIYRNIKGKANEVLE